MKISLIIVLLMALVLCTGCVNGRYQGPSIAITGGYQGATVGITLFGENPLLKDELYKLPSNLAK